jgi:hypothetical protein
LNTKRTSSTKRASTKKRSLNTKRTSSTKRASTKKRSVQKKATSDWTEKLLQKCRQAKIGITMREFNDKTLRLRNGQVVTNPKQAIAIALSQADRKC